MTPTAPTETALISAPDDVREYCASGNVALEVALTAIEAGRAEVALETSQERHRLLVQNLPDAMVTLYDRDLRCVMVEGTLPLARDAQSYDVRIKAFRLK